MITGMTVMTNLKDSDSMAKKILEGVYGQLSDGLWEDSPRMEKYWRNSELISKNGFLAFTIKPYDIFSYKNIDAIQKDIIDNGSSTVAAVLWNKLFSVWLKTIVKTELENSDEDLGEWKRDNTSELTYFGTSDDPITVRDAYRVYDSLLNRKERIPVKYTQKDYYDSAVKILQQCKEDKKYRESLLEK